MRLTKANISRSKKAADKAVAKEMELPEKVLQFGTGVLLRGLPDYFIDKANKQGLFNGRIVIVKSTDGGDTHAFGQQDGLYTQCIRGIDNGKTVVEDIINASVSRVLSAKSDWQAILACAANPAMEVVVSNTTEVGITMMKDDVNAEPPVSFPGKLLAFLYKRFQVFDGDVDKGMVILPTELIPENGDKLKSIIFELAKQNNLPAAFTAWLQNANDFCNTLVDRIVPGKLSEAQRSEVVEKTGFNDELAITSECYSLWAIQSSSHRVNETLSFCKADNGVVIAPDINKFRELKLRLLNGTHTFASGLAHIAGIRTVKEAMDNEFLSTYMESLMQEEIIPQIIDRQLTEKEALKFSLQVLDRFRNPHIEHPWLSITVQYASKMRLRNVPLLEKYYSRQPSEAPELMALGFAAHLLFMQCEKADNGKYYGRINGAEYLVHDDHAGYFAEKWMEGYSTGMVQEILSDADFWGVDLDRHPGFAQAVDEKLLHLLNGDIRKALKVYQSEKVRV